MKLLSLACPKCGAKVEVNADLRTATCNYCGNQFSTDTGIKMTHSQNFADASTDAGYNFEKGRMLAQEEAKYKAYLNTRIADLEMKIAEEKRNTERLIAQKKAAERKQINDSMGCLFVFGAVIAIISAIVVVLFVIGKKNATIPFCIACGLGGLGVLSDLCLISLCKQNGGLRRSDWILLTLILVGVGFLLWTAYRLQMPIGSKF